MNEQGCGQLQRAVFAAQDLVEMAAELERYAEREDHRPDTDILM